MKFNLGLLAGISALMGLISEEGKEVLLGTAIPLFGALQELNIVANARMWRDEISDDFRNPNL